MTAPRLAVWLRTNVEMLRSLWAEGVATPEIAKRISAASGLRVTKDAVVNKVHRLELTPRPNAINPPPYDADVWANAKALVLQDELSPREIAAKTGVTIDRVTNLRSKLGVSKTHPRPKTGPSFGKTRRLSRPAQQQLPIVPRVLVAAPAVPRSGATCQHIEGHGWPWTMCGAQARPGSPWCVEHYAVLTVKAQPREQNIPDVQQFVPQSGRFGLLESGL